jgi:hypothetical protein
VTRTRLTTGDARADESNARGPKRICATRCITEMGIPSVDDHITGKKVRLQIGDDPINRRPGRDHDQHHAGRRQFARERRRVTHRSFEPVPARESGALRFVVTARNQRKFLLKEALCQRPTHGAKTDETEREARRTQRD